MRPSRLVLLPSRVHTRQLAERTPDVRIVFNQWGPFGGRKIPVTVRAARTYRQDA
jgi:hypothetical protein